MVGPSGGIKAMVDVVVHDFQERLAFSNELSDEPAWIDFYKRLWPDMIAAIRIDKNSKFQKWGIDREILLPNGKRFTVDEKKRESDWKDILLEEWSVCDFDWDKREVIRGKKPGWAVDDEKRCDFIAYAMPKHGRCYLLPFELLRQTVKYHLPAWRNNKHWYPKAAKNNGYTTVNVAVPTDDLFYAMKRIMHRKFGEQAPLPLPSSNRQMTIFDHGVATTV